MQSEETRISIIDGAFNNYKFSTMLKHRILCTATNNELNFFLQQLEVKIILEYFKFLVS